MGMRVDYSGMVFPTCVGMNRIRSDGAPDGVSVPHVRGDEPDHIKDGLHEARCSPRAWG